MLNFSPLLCDGINGLVCILFSDVLVCSIMNYFYLRVVPEQLVKILSYTTHRKRPISYLLPNCLCFISRATSTSVNVRWQWSNLKTYTLLNHDNRVFRAIDLLSLSVLHESGFGQKNMFHHLLIEFEIIISGFCSPV